MDIQEMMQRLLATIKPTEKKGKPTEKLAKKNGRQPGEGKRR
jgi:hypothetical protein